MSVIYPTNSRVANVVNTLASFYKKGGNEFMQYVAFDFNVHKVSETHYHIILTDMEEINICLLPQGERHVMVTFIEQNSIGWLLARETYFVDETNNLQSDGWEVNLDQFKQALQKKYKEHLEDANEAMENTV